MKKFVFTLLMSLGVLVAFSENVNATELKVVTPEMQKEAEKLFGTLEESDSVLKLPDGGYLHGEAYDVDANNPEKVIATYDSEANPNAITVSEAKELIDNPTVNAPLGIATFGASPPPSSSFRYLANGAEYWSSKFSGSGWRFGEVAFMPAKGTGIYLGWQTFKDDGVVGGPNQANSTKAGSFSGSIVYVSQGYTYKTPGDYHPGFPYVMMYYTLNPISGTQYYVANI